MAASGIAEHDEARRREKVYLRKAHLQREYEEAKKNKLRQAQLEQASAGAAHNSYDCEVQQRLSQDQVDRERRLAHANQSRQEYSAKISNRYTSINYMSQW